MATLPNPPSDLTPEQLFLGHLDLIKAVIAHTCRRTRFGREDAQDFEGYVMEKLIDDNYARLRQFKAQSTLKTYLIVTIKRLLFDYRDHLWGKWRVSAEALRLGKVAQRLETLLVREEHTFDEAYQILRGEGVDLPEFELHSLRAKLPPRILRRMVGEEGLQSEPSRELRPDERFEAKERGVMKRRLFGILQRALADLPKEDRLLMLEWTEYKVADIARIHHVDQKPLYRRVDKIKEKLRKTLERQGVRRQDLDDIFED